ncbi:uncharacterized protein LOC111351537 [Spodoptera litura]|uniref:Uncharacterized protein LOC111351537 n=1 Tax=Spodoptera litura TaxID=69820 RepID=A0A9J7E0W9_SPOLT|nr:uncharacterized protein LOC111351537 [Spodoptera litura]
MSVTSRSSSINSNKRRIDEIDDTIEYLTNEVNKCDDFALKSDFESSLLALKLRREKVKALAAAARTQVLLADMEVLIAESDLLSDVERLKKYKKNKLDGGKDELQANQHESIRTMKSTSVQTSMYYRTERKKRKHSESGHSSKHSDWEAIRSQSIPKSPYTNQNSLSTCKDNPMEPLVSTQASQQEASQSTTMSTSVQTSFDDGNEHQPKKMKYNDPRCSPTHSDTETIQLQSVSRSPSAEKILCAILNDSGEPLVSTQASQQECTQIPESNSNKTSNAYRNEYEYEFTTSKLIDAIHSPMHIDIDMLEQSVSKSPITEKETYTSHKDGTEPLEKGYRSELEHEHKNRKPSDPRRTPKHWDCELTHWDIDTIEVQSISKTTTAVRKSHASSEDSLIEPLKVITGYTTDIDISLSSPLKAEFAKPYAIKQSQDIRKLQTESLNTCKVTPAPELKEKKKKKSKNKRKQENPAASTKPSGITTKTVSEINRRAFSPKPNPYNALISYRPQDLPPATSKSTPSTKAPSKHILPLMIPRPPPLGPCLGMGNPVPQTSSFQSTTRLCRSPYNFYNKKK